MQHKAERAMLSPPGKSVDIEGKTFTNFSGSYYLDLSGHPEVIAASCAAAQAFGMNSDLGYSIVGKPVLDIEAYGAQMLGFEDCLFCTSAFVGVMAVAAKLGQEYHRAFIDEKSHHSIRYGLRMAGIEAVEFRHCDADDLKQKIHESNGQSFVVMTDGVFPTWGDVAPIDAYVKALQSKNAILVIDDAHGLGILGQTGAGILEHFELDTRDGIYLVSSLSKAVGCQGALIGMSTQQKMQIKTHNPIYNSISLPTMATIAAGQRALELARNPEYRKNLQHQRKYLCEQLNRIGIAVFDEGTPIVTFSLGTKEMNEFVFNFLYERGFLVIRSDYVGAPNEGALRVTVMASHDRTEIDALCHAISQSLALFGA